MPLALIHEGGKAMLRAINGGRGLRGRLAALGLIPGVEIEVLRNSAADPSSSPWRRTGCPRSRHGDADRGRLTPTFF